MSRDAISNTLSKTSGYADTEADNTSGETGGKDYLTWNVKRWIVLPILMFHTVGFVVLLWLCFEFMYGARETPPYVWPALIVALAGIPYGFAFNVKKLVDAITPTS